MAGHHSGSLLENQQDIAFEVDLHDGRTARCWQAVVQPYQDCEISAGLCEGIAPDTVYFKLQRDHEDEPYMLFMRPDEMQALIFVCSGALWSHEIMRMEEAEKED